MRVLVLTVTAFAMLFAPTAAHAWGAQGHHLVAEVAYAHLTAHARAEVDRLVATGANDNATLCRISSIEDASTWADCVRRRPPFANEEHWHFVDTPICGHVPPPCPNNDCVIAAIGASERTLRDAGASDHERLLALARLIHFVGDVHQPLHAANNNDRGGNDDLAIYLGSPTYRAADGTDKDNNIHGIWDTPLVGAALGTNDAQAKATLEALIAQHGASWRSRSARTWANEAHQIAVDFVYARWPGPLTCGHPAAQRVNVDQAYVDAAAPIVRQQLARAALRLAASLNRDLR